MGQYLESPWTKGIVLKKTYNIEMEMKPENVPDEVLTQDEIVCTQLLICMNTPDIVWEILDAYMIALDIWMVQAGEHKLLIQLEMEELFSEWTVTTFRFVKLKDDILEQLRQWIDNDIEWLYEIVAQQERRHTICMTTDLPQKGTSFETAPQWGIWRD